MQKWLSTWCHKHNIRKGGGRADDNNDNQRERESEEEDDQKKQVWMDTFSTSFSSHAVAVLLLPLLWESQAHYYNSIIFTIMIMIISKSPLHTTQVKMFTPLLC